MSRLSNYVVPAPIDGRLWGYHAVVFVVLMAGREVMRTSNYCIALDEVIRLRRANRRAPVRLGFDVVDREAIV